MQIGTYGRPQPRYAGGQMSAFSQPPMPSFRSLIQTSAASDKPYAVQPAVAEDISELPAPVSAPPDLQETLRNYGRQVGEIVDGRLRAYGGAEVDSALSKGEWNIKPPMGIPERFAPALDAAGQFVPQTVLQPADFNRLLSGDTAPYHDPELVSLRDEYGQRAMSARGKADELRGKFPVMRRFMPLLNAHLNRSERDYRQLAGGFDAQRTDLAKNAAMIGESYKARLLNENLGNIRERQNYFNSFNNALAGAYQTMDNAYGTANRNAALDLQRFQALNNPSNILPLQGMAGVLGAAPLIANADTAFYEASPERRLRAEQTENAIRELNSRQTEAGINATNANASATVRNMQKDALGRMPLADQALEAIRDRKHPDAKQWLAEFEANAQEAIKNPQSLQSYLGQGAEAALAAQYEAAGGLDIGSTEYFNGFLEVVNANTAMLPLNDRKAYMVEQVRNLIPPNVMSRIPAEEQNAVAASLANTIVTQYLKMLQMRGKK